METRKPYAAIIFDMDGTLLDTLAEIAEAMNAALAELGHAPYPHAAYREFVGYGMEELARRVLPEHDRAPEQVSRCVAAMRRIYPEYAFQSRPYPGIPALLDALAEKGLATAILSNKPDDFTREMTTRLLGNWQFNQVRGIVSGGPRKPDPSPALELARLMGFSPERIVFMGDSAIDMITATNAGMFPVGVAWGFRSREELAEFGAGRIIDDPLEVLELFEP